MASKFLQTEKWLQSGALLAGEDGQAYASEGPFSKSLESEPRWNWLNPRFFFASDLSSQGIQGERDIRLSRTDIEKSIQPLISAPSPWPWTSPSYSSFRSLFHEAQERFRAEDLKKIVPVVFETARVNVTPQLLAYWLYQALRSGTKGTLFGKWDLNLGEGILGLTPEWLFSREGSKLSSMALAGTAQSADHNLLEDPKEMAEHHIVVEDLRRRLGTWGEVRTSPTYTWSPGRLRHLRTDFEVDVAGPIHDLSLVEALHPTPALGGDPRAEAMGLLRKWDEGVDRSYFGAPFGRVDMQNSKSEFVVAIRCLIWKDNQIRIGSGCGVVPMSQLSSEWSELSKKRESVKSTFGVLW